MGAGNGVFDMSRIQIVPRPPPGSPRWHRIKSLWTPEAYHGWGLRQRWFEGWYFKMVDAPGDAVMALIPGIFLGERPGEGHAFVQVLDGARGTAEYNRYPLDAFDVSRDGNFWVRVGPNHFSLEDMELDLDGPDGRVRGSLRMGAIRPWPSTFFSPGVMGPYTFAPFMQCYHGVLSLDHEISGSLEVGGEVLDFSGGRGYVERDWGRSFPRAWIWIQTNHFEIPGISLMFSAANVPWLGRSFPGLIAGLLLPGGFYPFTTYNGARIEDLRVDDDGVDICLRRGAYRLEIRADRPEGARLLSPEGQAMEARVVESMTGEVRVRLTRARSGVEETLYCGTGARAGTEVVGDLFP